METVLTGAERATLRSSTEDDQKPKPIENLATTIWNEMRLYSVSMSNSAKSIVENESFRKIIDSLPKAESLQKIDSLSKGDSPPGVAGDRTPKKTEWTIAIDFTTNFGDGQGVDSGIDNLRAFANKTKGKDITIVAQAAVAEAKDFDLETGEPIVTADTKYKVHRYVIKDGEIKNLGSDFSKGYADDLKELLEFASKNHPAKHTGLIMDSHGTGNEGLLGDTGKASVDDFVKAVQDGLKGSGHEKLDMIDFDACLMAANGAIAKISKVADQVVASAETESIYNGQNYLDPIKRLFDNPDASGFSLARDIVTQTHKDMEDWKKDGWNPSVETLAHLDLREYEGFRKSLDKFGDQLTIALNDQTNKQVIEAAIDQSMKYGGSGALLSSLFGDKLAGRHRTDLKEFTERVLSAIDNGEIKDPDRILKKAAQSVLNQRSLLVDSYHGEGPYGKSGGLSEFLPGKNLRNLEHEAALKTSAGRLCELTKNPAVANKDEKSRNEFITQVKTELFWARPHLYIFGTQGVDKELDQLDKLSSNFANAKDDKQRSECFKQLHQASIDLANTKPFKDQQHEHLKVLNEKVDKVFKVNSIDDSNGWSRFRLKLRNSVSK